MGFWTRAAPFQSRFNRLALMSMSPSSTPSTPSNPPDESNPSNFRFGLGTFLIWTAFAGALIGVATPMLLDTDRAIAAYTIPRQLLGRGFMPTTVVGTVLSPLFVITLITIIARRPEVPSGTSVFVGPYFIAILLALTFGSYHRLSGWWPFLMTPLLVGSAATTVAAAVRHRSRHAWSASCCCVGLALGYWLFTLGLIAPR